MERSRGVRERIDAKRRKQIVTKAEIATNRLEEREERKFAGPSGALGKGP